MHIYREIFSNLLETNAFILIVTCVQKRAVASTIPPTTTTTTPSPPRAPAFEDYEQTDAVGDLPDAVDNGLLSSMNTRPWYFIGGKRQPVEAKKSRKTKRRLAKLLPDENRWNDRITNQLMFVPPGYEKYRASGQFKTILLFNGLGPWNVKQGR